MQPGTKSRFSVFSTRSASPVTLLKTFTATAFAAVALLAKAHAAMLGSVPEYPVGITMGIPTGALPPSGVYLINKSSFSGATSVNNQGNPTGAVSSVWTSNFQIMWVLPQRVLGARYAVFIRNIGAVNTALTRNGVTSSTVGLPDTEFVPANLSWSVAPGLFVDAELGFYIPDGRYTTPTAVNIGQNHYTIEPNFAITYFHDGWAFTAHTVFDINGVNQQTHYRNGTTVDVDYTAFKTIGRWSFGPVGYYLKQITSDSGPARLNGGSPEQLALGLGGAYNFGNVRLNMNLTHDIVARNVGQKTMAMVFVTVPL